MKNKDGSRFIKFISGLLIFCGLLSLLMWMGSCVGPGIDSQAKAVPKFELVLNCLFSLCCFLTAKNIGLRKMWTYYSSITIFLCIGVMMAKNAVVYVLPVPAIIAFTFFFLVAAMLRPTFKDAYLHPQKSQEANL